MTTDFECLHFQIKKRDDDLAKAKRMMVALNNKFKAKFAKMEEMNAAKAAEGGGPQHELEEAKAKLATCHALIDELQKALASEQTICAEFRSRAAGASCPTASFSTCVLRCR